MASTSTPRSLASPAVAEEEEIGLRLVALDQVVDVVLVGIHRQLCRRHRVAHGQIELQAGLGGQIRIAGDEATSGRPTEVAIREHGVAKAA